jgi:hypothetical protein
VERFGEVPLEGPAGDAGDEPRIRGEGRLHVRGELGPHLGLTQRPDREMSSFVFSGRPGGA